MNTCIFGNVNCLSFCDYVQHKKINLKQIEVLKERSMQN